MTTKNSCVVPAVFIGGGLTFVCCLGLAGTIAGASYLIGRSANGAQPGPLPGGAIPVGPFPTIPASAGGPGSYHGTPVPFLKPTPTPWEDTYNGVPIPTAIEPRVEQNGLPDNQPALPGYLDEDAQKSVPAGEMGDYLGRNVPLLDATSDQEMPNIVGNKPLNLTTLIEGVDPQTGATSNGMLARALDNINTIRIAEGYPPYTIGDLLTPEVSSKIIITILAQRPDNAMRFMNDNILNGTVTKLLVDAGANQKEIAGQSFASFNITLEQYLDLKARGVDLNMFNLGRTWAGLGYNASQSELLAARQGVANYGNGNTNAQIDRPKVTYGQALLAWIDACQARQDKGTVAPAMLSPMDPRHPNSISAIGIREVLIRSGVPYNLMMSERLPKLMNYLINMYGLSTAAIMKGTGVDQRTANIVVKGMIAYKSRS